MKKKLLITALVITTLAAGAVGAQGAFATSTSSNPTLVQMIANKFGLNQSDVQQVFDQYKQQHAQNMQQNYQARLDQLVKDGKLTSDQEKLILDEHQKLMTEHASDFQNIKSMAKDQRKNILSSIHQEISVWSKANNIPVRYLLPGISMGRMGMFLGSSTNN